MMGPVVEASDVAGEAPVDAPDAGDGRATLFALGLAVAALFHLAGNPRPSFEPGAVVLTLVQLGVGVAAVATCLRPRQQATLLALCALIPISAWMEAPTVGNHWVLAALLALGYLVAWSVGRLRGGGADRVATIARFLPSGRLILLIAYGFAGFAKLNSDFFDPLQSCAVFYQDQLVSSLGLGGLSAAGRPSLGTLVAVVSAAVELSIPLLLLSRRTRRPGVLVGLSFHWLVALDLDQHFWDFSSVLFVGFLLFLDDGQVHALRAGTVRAWSDIRRPVRVVLGACVVACGALAVAASVGPAPSAARGWGVALGHVTWWLVGTGVLVGVWVATMRSVAEPVRLRLPPVFLCVVPLVVALNGLTPYLEVKTGFGWQMYSNLRTVAGETNHLLLPATLDVTGTQEDRVEILASSDPALAGLVDNGYEVVLSELREYAADHPDESVTYRRDGVVRIAEPIGDDPALAGGVGVLSRKLQPYRVVDASGDERCLTVFSPAR